MTSNTSRSLPLLLGHVLGHACKACGLIELRVSKQLLAWGMPSAAVMLLMGGVKLIAIGLLLYFVFWLTLSVVFVVALLRIAPNTPAQEESQWAFPTTEELSKTAGYDPVLHNDSTHCDFVEQKSEHK